jgi:N-acetylmuramoyl-L-alanine amidase
MRRIDNIVLHCTAGSQKQTIEGLKAWWKDGMKWKQVGYHWVIEADGGLTQLVQDDIVTNGVGGHNAHSIHISYFGGVDLRTWKAVDNRTPAQKESMYQLVRSYKLKYPDANILGHRDFPGVKKACPSFDVATWLKEVGLK